MQQNHTTKFVLHFISGSQPLAPEEEIRRVFQFLGLALICGKIDIPTFDQVVNGLIKACRGDFRWELVEAKRTLKAILAQCDAQEVVGR